MKKRKIYFPMFLVFVFMGFCLTSPLLFRNSGVVENIEYYAMLYVSFLIIICVGVYVLFVRDEGRWMNIGDIPEGEYCVEFVRDSCSNGVKEKSDGMLLVLSPIERGNFRYFSVEIKGGNLGDDLEEFDCVTVYKEQGKKKIKKE